MTQAITNGATIRLFLVDGTPQGIRVVNRSQWTGVCLAFSRADYASARLREEFRRTGVYLLTGPDPDATGPDVLYIGEGDSVAVRLDSHQRNKDFWTNAYVLTTTDDSLNKVHVRYLEARFIKIAMKAGVVHLDNGTAPDLPWLSEPEIADMEAYLANMLIILPIVGVHAFEAPITAAEVAKVMTTDGIESRTTYFLNAKSTTAEGTEDSRGFTVFEGALGRSRHNDHVLQLPCDTRKANGGRRAGQTWIRPDPPDQDIRLRQSIERRKRAVRWQQERAH
ncbi:GIY-YIG nuclease family protein [Saccharothrix sp. 6-C]|uniref:GIY-YIG nuclease family protein n=1 Tax=Saccharothrix sp. 6-C TaxID=2781735 RepID=UPI001F1BCA96|nr:GIY-YIG nuclease family protein [Saccharothrix sp. 6-C]